LQLGDNVGRSMGDHVLAAIRADHHAGAGEQAAHQIGNLGERTDRRARRPLLWRSADGDRGGQVANVVGVGLVETLQELAGCGREALQITPLRLGI